MPDTLSREEIAAIARHAEHGITQDAANVRALLAHIDALTAAVENARVEGAAYAEEDNWFGGVEAMRAAVLAILRGEQDPTDSLATIETRPGDREWDI